VRAIGDSDNVRRLVTFGDSPPLALAAGAGAPSAPDPAATDDRASKEDEVLGDAEETVSAGLRAIALLRIIYFGDDAAQGPLPSSFGPTRLVGTFSDWVKHLERVTDAARLPAAPPSTSASALLHLTTGRADGMPPLASDFQHSDARIYLQSLQLNGRAALAQQLSHQIMTRPADSKERAQPTNSFLEFDEGGSATVLNALAMLANMTNVQGAIEGGQRYNLNIPVDVMNDLAKAIAPPAVNDRERLAPFPRVELFGGPLNVIYDFLSTIARCAGFNLDGQGDSIIRLLSAVNGVKGDLHVRTDPNSPHPPNHFGRFEIMMAALDEDNALHASITDCAAGEFAAPRYFHFRNAFAYLWALIATATEIMARGAAADCSMAAFDQHVTEAYMHVKCTSISMTPLSFLPQACNTCMILAGIDTLVDIPAHRVAPQFADMLTCLRETRGTVTTAADTLRRVGARVGLSDAALLWNLAGQGADVMGALLHADPAATLRHLRPVAMSHAETRLYSIAAGGSAECYNVETDSFPAPPTSTGEDGGARQLPRGSAATMASAGAVIELLSSSASSPDVADAARPPHHSSGQILPAPASASAPMAVGEGVASSPTRERSRHAGETAADSARTPLAPPPAVAHASPSAGAPLATTAGTPQSSSAKFSVGPRVPGQPLGLGLNREEAPTATRTRLQGPPLYDDAVARLQPVYGGNAAASAGSTVAARALGAIPRPARLPPRSFSAALGPSLAAPPPLPATRSRSGTAAGPAPAGGPATPAPTPEARRSSADPASGAARIVSGARTPSRRSSAQRSGYAAQGRDSQ